jgi:hypothetical protein
MNHLISQEWQERGLRILCKCSFFLSLMPGLSPFNSDTLWVPECFERLRKSCSFFTIFHQKWTCYCTVLEAPTKGAYSKSIKFECPCIKDHIYKHPLFLFFLFIWTLMLYFVFLFGTVTLHCRLDYLLNSRSYARPPQFLHCAPVCMLESIRFTSQQGYLYNFTSLKVR